jgi:hypothetical protein
MATEKVQKVPSKFACDVCDYNTSRQSQYERHLTTRKHLNAENFNKTELMATKSSGEYTCSKCSKNYKERTGLWKHNQKCKPEPEKSETVNLIIPPQEHTESDIKILTNIVLEIVKSHADLQKQMLDSSKTTNSHNHKNSHNNSHNKTFNLQFFLNEQCKDAMNIMDFVNTFQLSLADFERIGEVGYVEGISNIVIDKLNQMDVYKRPIHCSDAKRETMHVKDNDVWVKDSSANDKIRLALKHITKKNTDLIRPWLNAHPGVLNSEHRLNDKYQEMFIEAMGGRKNKNMKEGEDKIIKKICKMVLIDKNQ